MVQSALEINFSNADNNWKRQNEDQSLQRQQ